MHRRKVASRHRSVVGSVAPTAKPHVLHRPVEVAAISGHLPLPTQTTSLTGYGRLLSLKWKGNKDSDQGSLNDPPTQKQSSPFHCAFEIAGEGLPQ